MPRRDNSPESADIPRVFPTEPAPHIRLRSLPNLLMQDGWRIALPRARRSHDFFWLVRGHGRIRIDGRLRGLTPNTAVVVPAGHVHGLELSGPVQGFAAFVPDELPLPVPQDPAIVRARSIFAQGQVTGLFEQLMQERDSPPRPGRVQAMEAHVTLLSVWFERHRADNEWQPPATGAERLVRRFLRRLESGIGRAAEVAHYAEALEVTPTHLARACRAVTGETPRDLIRARQLLQARLLLADGRASARRVAAACGFRSDAHFSRLFKAETGMTPLAFRRAAQAPAPPPAAPARRVIRLGEGPESG